MMMVSKSSCIPELGVNLGPDAVISKKRNYCQCPQQNYCCISAHEAGLQMTNYFSCFLNRIAKRMEEAIDHADIKQLPEAFARADFDWVDNRRVVNLVDVIFLFQYLGHLKEWTLPEDHPAGSDTCERNRD